MDYLELPRNYGFISRLPDEFELKVIKKGNVTSEGTWYNGLIGNHDINLLSKVNLVEGHYYKIHKKDNLTLELGEKISKFLDTQNDRDYFG
jgi:hypothetical protein